MTGALIRRAGGGTDTQRRTPRKGEGRDQSNVSTRQGMPRIAGKQRKLEGRHGTDSPSELPGRTDPSHDLLSDI